MECDWKNQSKARVKDDCNDRDGPAWNVLYKPHHGLVEQIGQSGHGDMVAPWRSGSASLAQAISSLRTRSKIDLGADDAGGAET